ncbi:hypothetical protein KY345_06660, partial [Candidatus Woesearchaeota archaeon]|nr:hypothetical protein [Candidatus Woesearchaeota archaeon]
MSFMKRVQLIALFMVMLVIMLPVCFAADYVAITKVSGKDDIWDGVSKGYMGGTDYYKIEVQAEREDGAEVSPDDVRLFMGVNELSLDGQCVLNTGSRYNCSYQSEENWRPGADYEIKAQLCYGGKCINAPLPMHLIVDKIGPEIIKADQPKQEGRNLTVTLSARDYSYGGAYSTDCSKIDKINFYYEESLVHTEEIDDEDLTECGLDDHKANFDMSASGAGERTLTIKAVDKLGNEGEGYETDSFNLDHSEPQIVDKSFMIKDAAGNKINRIPSTGTLISAEVLLETEPGDAVQTTAYADFSALSTDAYSNVTGTCSHVSTRYYRCEWSGIQLDKTGDGSSFVIYAEDSFGNELRGSPGPYPIAVEATAPRVHGTEFAMIKDGRRMTGVAAAGGYADFYANLTDEYPGVDIRNVFADFSQLGGDSRTPVSSCRRELTCTQVEVDETTGEESCIGKIDDVYVCVWSNVFVKIGETTEATIAIDAADQFGNKGTISIDWDMELDNTAPAIRHLGVGEEHVRDGKNWYLPRADTKLTVVVDETGSGVEKDNVIFNYDSTSIKATNCTAVSGGYKCWV